MYTATNAKIPAHLKLELLYHFYKALVGRKFLSWVSVHKNVPIKSYRSSNFAILTDKLFVKNDIKNGKNSAC